MKRLRITYTETARASVRHIPPIAKRAIKALIEKLAEDPRSGKALKEELAGYWSMRIQSWRVIYIIEEDRQAIQIQLIEKRVSVYETLKGIVSARR